MSDFLRGKLTVDDGGEYFAIPKSSIVYVVANGEHHTKVRWINRKASNDAVDVIDSMFEEGFDTIMKKL